MFGSHLSIAGGLHRAVNEAVRIGFDTVQVFTKNQQQWQARPLDEASISTWQRARGDARFNQIVSHDSYLINLASPDPVLRERSRTLFEIELQRCRQLSIPYLVTHPGAHRGLRDDTTAEQQGLERAAGLLNTLLVSDPEGSTTVCIESTAGQGTSIGHKLEHLAFLVNNIRPPHRVAICLDTAHLFAAGHDFRGLRYTSFLRRLDASVGLERVRVWHLNDSKKALGTRVDRHAHIGLGEIGLDGFRPIVRDKRWREIPKILETPKEKDAQGRDWDAVNLETLKRLMSKR